MGLWKRLFGRRDLRSFDEDAPPPRDREAFWQLIAREGAWLVAREIKGSDITFIDYIDASGQRVWPLFSTQGMAARWVSQSGVEQAAPFPCLKLNPGAVLRLMPENALVVFDEKSDYARVMTEQDHALLKSLIGPGSTVKE